MKIKFQMRLSNASSGARIYVYINAIRGGPQQIKKIFNQHLYKTEKKNL